MPLDVEGGVAGNQARQVRLQVVAQGQHQGPLAVAELVRAGVPGQAPQRRQLAAHRPARLPDRRQDGDLRLDAGQLVLFLLLLDRDRLGLAGEPHQHHEPDEQRQGRDDPGQGAEERREARERAELDGVADVEQGLVGDRRHVAHQPLPPVDLLDLGVLDVLAEVPHQVVEAEAGQGVGHFVGVDEAELVHEVPDVRVVDAVLLDHQRRRLERVDRERLGGHAVLEDDDLLAARDQVGESQPVALRDAVAGLDDGGLELQRLDPDEARAGQAEIGRLGDGGRRGDEQERGRERE